MLNLIDFLPQPVAGLFRKRPNTAAQEECTNEVVYDQVRRKPLASSIGARHKGCEISGHWTIRGQEVFLDYKRTAQELRKPEISQNISKAELKGYHSKAS